MALPEGTAIALSGNGRLVASKVEEVPDLPARVLLDFEGVAMGSVPATTAVNQGEVQRVRVAVNRQEPLITRVVIDLARKIPYTVQSVGQELRVLFTRAADAASALVAPEPARATEPAAPEPARTPAAATPVRESAPVLTNTDVAPTAAPQAAPATGSAARTDRRRVERHAGQPGAGRARDAAFQRQPRDLRFPERRSARRAPHLRRHLAGSTS